MAVLVLTNSNPPGQVVELVGSETLIGRLPRCQIVLDSNGVSREHARIRRQGESYVLIDLESRNRTRLNERFIPPLSPQPLRPGDRISICDVELVFHLSPPPAGPGDQVQFTEGEGTTLHTLDASRSDILATAVKPEVKLKAILEISRNLSTNLRLESLAPRVLDSLLALFPQAERAFMVLIREDDAAQTGKWSIRQTFHRLRPERRSAGMPLKLGTVPADEARLSLSRSIVNHVIGQQKAILSQDAGADENLPTSASIADLKIRSVMCVPLLTPDGQVLGIIQIDTSDRRQFHQDDLDVLLAVAGQAAIALQNAAMHESLIAQERLKRDLNLAQTIQKRFLPERVPQPPGYEFFAHYHAAYEVGGDYYDFVELGPDRLAIALGDVAGKGVAAALMMAKFSGDTRACLLTERAPGPAATLLNALLHSTGIDDKFITLSLSVLDVPGRRLTVSSAGHPPIFIRRAGGQLEACGGSINGFPLGIDGLHEYAQTEVTLAPGDVVVIYSDGVTDARNQAGDTYDSIHLHRLEKRIQEVGGGPGVLGRAILQEIREFSAGNPQFDDITLICFGPTA